MNKKKIAYVESNVGECFKNILLFYEQIVRWLLIVNQI